MTARDAAGLKRTVIGTATVISCTLGVQIGVLIYWAGAISTRVEHLEQGMMRIDNRVDNVCRDVNTHIRNDRN